jgi:hypothetical protein
VEGKELLRRLAAVFSEEATYFNGDSKGCAVGVGFRFRNDKMETLDIRCCMMKGNIIMVMKDAAGKTLVEKDCRGFRNDKDAKVRTIAAELFPDDKEIQKFKPKRPSP